MPHEHYMHRDLLLATKPRRTLLSSLAGPYPARLVLVEDGLVFDDGSRFCAVLPMGENARAELDALDEHDEDWTYREWLADPARIGWVVPIVDGWDRNWRAAIVEYDGRVCVCIEHNAGTGGAWARSATLAVLRPFMVEFFRDRPALGLQLERALTGYSPALQCAPGPDPHPPARRVTPIWRGAPSSAFQAWDHGASIRAARIKDLFSLPGRDGRPVDVWLATDRKNRYLVVGDYHYSKAAWLPLLLCEHLRSVEQAGDLDPAGGDGRSVVPLASELGVELYAVTDTRGRAFLAAKSCNGGHVTGIEISPIMVLSLILHLHLHLRDPDGRPPDLEAALGAALADSLLDEDEDEDEDHAMTQLRHLERAIMGLGYNVHWHEKSGDDAPSVSLSRRPIERNRGTPVLRADILRASDGAVGIGSDTWVEIWPENPNESDGWWIVSVRGEGCSPTERVKDRLHAEIVATRVLDRLRADATLGPWRWAYSSVGEGKSCP